MLIELAFIKLTKPEMEQSMDSVLERLEKLERMVEEMSAGGYVPVQTAGMDGDPMINAGQQIPPQAYAQPVYNALARRETAWVPSGQPAQNPTDMQNQQGAGQNYEPRTYPCRKPSWKIST